jgi:site-specific DNA-methyltransferase (adenine-specific)
LAIVNRLYYGDNLNVLKKYIKDESVDLVYLDPPFNSDRNYNILFKQKDAPSAGADNPQILAFTDTWTWGNDDAQLLKQLQETAAPRVSDTLTALYKILGQSDMMSYIVMMAPRLVELRRVLKPTGSIYLHCDMSAAHYLKVLMDSIFGPENFLNNVVWLYGLGGSSNRYWPRKHDDLLWYSRKPDGQYFEADRVPATSNRLKGQDKKAPDYWDIPTINNMSKERLGYPTQKPLALLERVVRSSCPEGGVVLDPFCGCGTAVAAAQALGRQWIGIDITFLAVNLIRERMRNMFGSECEFELHGVPADVASARQLFQTNAFDFERWAVTLIGGHPNDKQVGDKGIDGKVRFWDTPTELGDVIVSVKGGEKLNPSMIRDLVGTVQRVGAPMGLFICLTEPTKGMIQEAQSAGLYEHYSGNSFPKIQILTIADALKGVRPQMPTPESPYKAAEQHIEAPPELELGI